MSAGDKILMAVNKSSNRVCAHTPCCCSGSRVPEMEIYTDQNRVINRADKKENIIKICLPIFIGATIILAALLTRIIWCACLSDVAQKDDGELQDVVHGGLFPVPPHSRYRSCHSAELEVNQQQTHFKTRPSVCSLFMDSVWRLLYSE